VYPVFTGGSNSVVGGLGTSVPSGIIASASIPGGQRIIQFPNTGAIALSARTTTAVGLNYNTATNEGQVNFFPASRGNFGIFWAGNYYIRVSASSVVNTQATSCSTSTGADQLFVVTCPGALDPFGNITAAAQQWASGTPAVSIFSPANNNIYFGSVPWDASGSYCSGNDAYCGGAQIGGSIGTGAFKTVALSTPTNPGFTNGAASSISYRITYRVPYGIAPNATNTAANSNQVTFMVFFQNPLLLSPFAYLGLANPLASTMNASNANAAPSQNVVLDMPGTWTINSFNTNGCANISSASAIDLSAYCYDFQLPEANLVFQVISRLPPLGNSACPGGVTNDAASNPQCDVTLTAVTYCSNVAAVRGPLGRPGGNGGTGYARRRLGDSDNMEAAADGSKRKLLQTSSATIGACAFNGNGLQAGNLGGTISFTNPAASGTIAAASTSYSTAFGTTPILSPTLEHRSMSSSTLSTSTPPTLHLLLMSAISTEWATSLVIPRFNLTPTLFHLFLPPPSKELSTHFTSPSTALKARSVSMQPTPMLTISLSLGGIFRTGQAPTPLVLHLELPQSPLSQMDKYQHLLVPTSLPPTRHTALGLLLVL